MPLAPPAPMKRAEKRRTGGWKKLVIASVLLALLALAWRFTPLADFITRENVNAWARAARAAPWAPFALVLAFTPAALFMFPRPVLTLMAVVAFGPWKGFGYSAAGIMVAAMVFYYAGRVMRRDTVLRLAGGRLDEVSKALREHGIVAVFASNMVPVPPFSVQGLIAGAIRIRTWDYVVGSILGMAPGLLASTVFAREIRSILEDPSNISWWMLAGIVALFAGFIWFIRRWLARRMGGGAK